MHRSWIPPCTRIRIASKAHPPNARWSAFPRHFASAAEDRAHERTREGHSRFLAEAGPRARWKENQNEIETENGEDFDTVTNNLGKLAPTSSHLYKLVLPLGRLRSPRAEDNKSELLDDAAPEPEPEPPTIILLHPSQPLSHASRLIAASLAPATPSISFRSESARGQVYQWSDSTDVGDFVRDAARSAHFAVCIADADAGTEETIAVQVPTFADRTRFLRRRLVLVRARLAGMETLKRSCDAEAHRGAKRMALGGFGMLVVYWGAVARLTFWDLGWDIMEPITYLSGLTGVICGYLWFLYQGREVSYTSVLDRSISSRREALYKARGFDFDRWIDSTREVKSIKREISRIAADYDDGEEEEDSKDEKADKKAESKTKTIARDED